MSQTERADRTPELDGVRGLAILMVMVYHLMLFSMYLPKNTPFREWLVQAVSMGWAGVDLFFVLSGFLITSILLRTRNDPHYFRNFYARRILRIFPLYYLAVVIVYMILPFYSPDLDPAAVRASQPFFLFYLQNWIYIPKFSASFHTVVPPLFGPAWSLAIEEQFYILWPSVVYFLNRRKLFILSVAVVIFTFLARVALVQFSSAWPSLEYFLYYSTVTRFDGLCIGALIAIVFAESERWKQVFSRFAWPVLIGALAGMVGIVLVNSNVFALSTNPGIDMGGYTLLALGGGALVVLVTTGPAGGILRTFFRNPVLTFFGKYSYAMYIIHVPVALLLLRAMKVLQFKNDFAWVVFVVLSFGLIVLGALLTWNLLEKHALGLKKYFEYRRAGE
ncbi:MAG: acyltransferase [Anaerolineales bacterium]